MGGLFGGGAPAAAAAAAAPAAPSPVIGGYTAATNPTTAPLSSGGYPDDGAKRMPSASDQVSLESMRKTQTALSARSGRQSTDLSSAGTRSYSNVFLGSTN